jgi:hypothetical protein
MRPSVAFLAQQAGDYISFAVVAALVIAVDWLSSRVAAPLRDARRGGLPQASYRRSIILVAVLAPTQQQ